VIEFLGAKGGGVKAHSPGKAQNRHFPVLLEKPHGKDNGRPEKGKGWTVWGETQ